MKKRYWFHMEERDFKFLMQKVKDKGYEKRNNQLGLYLGEVANQRILILPPGKIKVTISTDN